MIDQTKTNTGSVFRTRDPLLKDDAFSWLWVVLLTFLAGAIRFVIGTRSGLWRDEGQCLFIACFPSLDQVFRFLHDHEAHAPLFYLIMRTWMFLFGKSDLALSSFPILASMALVPTVYFLGRKIFGNLAALLAATLVTISAGIIEFGTMIRPYSVLGLLGLMSSLLLINALLGKSRRWWIGYSISAALLLYSHNWAVLVVVAQGISALLFLLANRSTVKSAYLQLVSAYVLTGILYSPWVSTLLNQSRNSGHSPVNVPLMLGTSARNMIKGDTNPIIYFVFMGVAAGCIMLVSVLRMRSDRQVTSSKGNAPMPQEASVSARCGVIILSGITFFAVSLAMVLSARSDLLRVYCLLTLLPGFLLVFTYFVVSLSSASAAPKLRPVAYAGWMILLVLCAKDLRGTWKLSHTVKSNAREVAQTLSEKVAADDLIFITPGHYASSLNWYNKLPNDQIAYPVIGRLEADTFDNFSPRVASAESAEKVQTVLKAARSARRRVWFLNRAGDPLVSIPLSESIPVTKEGATPVRIRGGQMLGVLRSLYGEPVPVSVEKSNKTGKEFDVYLFTP